MDKKDFFAAVAVLTQFIEAADKEAYEAETPETTESSEKKLKTIKRKII